MHCARRIPLPAADLGVIARPRGRGSRRGEASAPAGVLAGARTAAARSAGTWKLLPSAPLDRIAGGPDGGGAGRDDHPRQLLPGAGGIRGVTVAYRPATRTWARLAMGRPSAFETTDAAAWTGSRMLVRPDQRQLRPGGRLLAPDVAARCPCRAVTGLTGRLLARAARQASATRASTTRRPTPGARCAPLIVRRNASGPDGPGWSWPAASTWSGPASLSPAEGRGRLQPGDRPWRR